jgi:hypothetical protein
MVGATSTQIMEIVCLAHANLYDKRIQLTSLASLGIGATFCYQNRFQKEKDNGLKPMQILIPKD